MTNRPGTSTSEFWLSICTTISGILMAILPDNPITQVVGGIISAVSAPAYAVSRGLVKSRLL